MLQGVQHFCAWEARSPLPLLQQGIEYDENGKFSNDQMMDAKLKKGVQQLGVESTDFGCQASKHGLCLAKHGAVSVEHKLSSSYRGIHCQAMPPMHGLCLSHKLLSISDAFSLSG
ncbi:hypothetical protein TanjilG_29217 [Lupinus angustifolius]|uniref:Uncharacterized protein n=1 Tax=Lupinus angustifolius TaxID=3871 RepID=A0A1J7G117_LUPAN|nr:hypothetical protein TanjilG_29217 [Lupinus angustifolius]